MPKGFSKMEEAAIKASLLKSGRNRFVRTGLRGTTVDSLAQDAGISKGAFYKFFQSKEELFFDLVEEKEQEIRAKIKPNDLPDEPKLLAQFLLSLVKESLEDPLLRIISDPGEYQALLRKLPSERVQEHIQADEKDLGLSMGRFLKHRWGSELDEHILAGVLRAVMLLVLHPEELGPRSDEILLTILQGVLEKMRDSMIKVKNLSYTYRKQRKPTINGLDFTVGAGEIFGFLGPSGAGKSTTQKVLIGLLGGFQGNVELLGQSVSSWRRDLYKEIGVAFESPNLYGKLSAKENLEYFCGLSQGDPSLIPELLDRVGLWADADKMVDQFSKGMKMRLNVVRAFLHNPKILFLDEPTSGLDPASAVRVKDLIREARSKGKAIFLTTHNMNLADELCDNLAFLNKGEIAAMNTPHKLKAAHGERRVQVVVDGQEKYFPMDDLVGSSDFLDFLGSGTLERIHSLEAPMEEVFLKVTGSVLW